MATALLNQEPVEFLDAPPLVPFWAPAVSAVPSPHELPVLPELAEAAARAEVPDLPPTLQAPRLPGRRDGAAVAGEPGIPRRPGAARVPRVPGGQSPARGHELPASEEWPQAEEVQQAAELPPVVEASRGPEWSQARELALAREWPQVVEFVEVLQGPALTQDARPRRPGGARAVPTRQRRPPSRPVMSSPHTLTPGSRPRLPRCPVRAWALPSGSPSSVAGC